MLSGWDHIFGLPGQAILPSLPLPMTWAQAPEYILLSTVQGSQQGCVCVCVI